MKVKRLLAAFLAVAMMLTTMVAFGTVSYAAEVTSATPVVSISFEPDSTYSVGEGEYGYRFIAKLSNYGTLYASDDDYTGRKLIAWQVSLIFPDGVYSGNNSKKAASDLSTKPSVGLDGNALNFAFAAGNADQQHPYEGSLTGEITLVNINVKTKSDKFDLGVKGMVEIANPNAEGGIPVGANTKYSTLVDSYEALNIPASITIGSAPATTYDITFDVNGTTTVVPTEEGAVPVAPTVNGYEDEGYTYTFAGWDKEVVAATEATTYTAKFTKTAKIFNITFDVNGKTTTVPTAYGEVPVAPTVESYKDDKGGMLYTFKNWTPALVAVTGEATYTAVFEESNVEIPAPEYVYVRFNVFGKVTEVLVEKGTAITFPTEVVFPEDDYNYTFVGWTNDVTSAGTPVETENVLATESVTYYAMFKAEIKDAVVSVEAGALNGVAGKDGVVYDNAYKTEATFTRIAGASEIGILFIPAAVAERDTEWTTAVPASVVGDIVGNGSVTVRTAIIKLPARFSGKTLTMLVKPFYMLNNVMVTGEQSSVDIEFTKNLD